MTAPASAAETVQQKIARYRWYHFIDAGGGVITPGVEAHRPPQELTRRALDRIDFAGKRVLDVGCRDGLFSFYAERHGAAEVIGIDNDLSRGAVEFLIPHLGSSVRMKQMNLMDLTLDTFGQFDVLVCAGVLYHLRYPFHALRKLSALVRPGGLLVLETAIVRGWEGVPMLYCPPPDESPYEASSVTFFNPTGMRASLHSFGQILQSEEYLLGPSAFTLPHIGWRLKAGAFVNQAQRVAPRLVKMALRKFVIDRGVYVSKPAAKLPHSEDTFPYWEGVHQIHTTQPAG